MIFFQDFPGPGILKKKIQDFPGSVRTLSALGVRVPSCQKLQMTA